MAVTYKVVSKRPGGIAGKPVPKYYPIITDRSIMDERAISEFIADRSGMHIGAVLAVTEALFQAVPDLLMNGYNVKLNNFGTFSLHVSAEGKDSKQEVNASDIKKVRMAFLPSKPIKQRLSQTEFRKKK